jgi:hypothetical protein
MVQRQPKLALAGMPRSARDPPAIRPPAGAGGRRRAA